MIIRDKFGGFSHQNSIYLRFLMLPPHIFFSPGKSSIVRKPYFFLASRGWKKYMGVDEKNFNIIEIQGLSNINVKARFIKPIRPENNFN
jgi:hypothetical protein